MYTSLNHFLVHPLANIAFCIFKFVVMAGNREERRQRISDLVIRSWREDHRVVLLMINLDIHNSIATDMKMRRVAVAEILSFRPVFRTHIVYMAVNKVHSDNDVLPV